MFSTKNLKRYGYGCLLALVLAGVFLAVHIDISALGIDEYGLTRTDGYLTTGTCSRSGVYTLKFVRNPSSHSTYTTHWSPGLPDLTFGYHIVLDGYGFVQASMTYSVNGVSGTKNWGPERVGDWGHKGMFSLWVPHATRVTASAYAPSISSFDFDVEDAYGEYTWNSSGTVNLQAMYCKRSAAFWGEWEPIGQPIPETWNSQGSWELKMTYVCPKCSQDVSHFNEHQVVCNSGIVTVSYATGLVKRVHVGGCGKTFWKCTELDAHRFIDGVRDARRACCPPIIQTTTSPTVQNNGGTNGGATGGDSSSRVQCGNAGSARSHCDKGGYASSRTAHETTCTNAVHRTPVTYWSCDATARRHHTTSRSHTRPTLTCRRCGTTFTRGNNGTCRPSGAGWRRSYSSHWGT